MGIKENHIIIPGLIAKNAGGDRVGARDRGGFGGSQGGVGGDCGALQGVPDFEHDGSPGFLGILFGGGDVGYAAKFG